MHTDDEVYRVDAVWLGPPRVTFPWRARYVDYGLGMLVMIVLIALQRRVGLSVDVFTVAWSMIATVLIVTFLGRRISSERPLGHITNGLLSEIRTPRNRRRGTGGALASRRIRVRDHVPPPRRAR